MEALVSGMMAGLDRRRILRNTQTAKEENRKRGRSANAKITLPQGIDFDFKTGNWSWVEPWATRIKTAFDILVTTNRSVLSIAKQLGYASHRVLYGDHSIARRTASNIYVAAGSFGGGSLAPA